ncbi:hypothetical protein [Actinomadura sp. NTSP31]|uniref:hypothetical protein n=1 Tax=Actinomadura sp. NTSP31 TaxID=1735447 RepID=UPI0035C0ABB1
MTERIVHTRLFGLDRALCVARPGRGTAGDVAAVLVIPRGGTTREPRLALFTASEAALPAPPGRLRAADAHTVVRHDDSGDGRRLETADVLAGPVGGPPSAATARLGALLHRYPGCGVAVGHTRGGSLAVLRSGRTVRAAVPPGAEDLWREVYGSFLYCWTAAGLPADDLDRAIVVPGRLHGADSGPACLLEAVGRVELIPSAPDGTAVRGAAS